MQIEYWVFLGIIISIFASTFDLPLSPSKLVFVTFLGILGAVVGGVTAYLLADITLIGTPVSTITIITFTALLIVFQRKQLEKLIPFLKGGEKYVRWNIQ